MQSSIPTELFWLAMSAIAVALYWMPYVLNRIAVLGLVSTLQNPSDTAAQPSGWAIRAQKAHGVAIENLPVFAVLILITQHLQISNSITVGASALYFFGMLAHYVVFTLGIPYLRTLLFAVAGFGVEMALALSILGLI